MVNGALIAGLIISLVGGGLAGSLFTYIVNKRRERAIARLEMWCFPSFERDTSNRVHCFCRLTLYRSHKSIEWIDIWPSSNSQGMVAFWPSRAGLTCALVDNQKVRISNMRADDYVDLLLLLPAGDVTRILQENKLIPAIIDCNSSGLVFVQGKVLLPLAA